MLLRMFPLSFQYNTMKIHTKILRKHMEKIVKKKFFFLRIQPSLIKVDIKEICKNVQ